ncbi:uncharacterized protein ZBAI_08243 [Zygosaccharomyces bailii ISA1307]|nr:uncharacterized protein ZBAI_08243 [Zygosaccharomyces bailii ISA1307]
MSYTRRRKSNFLPSFVSTATCSVPVRPNSAKESLVTEWPHLSLNLKISVLLDIDNQWSNLVRWSASFDSYGAASQGTVDGSSGYIKHRLIVLSERLGGIGVKRC